ncbi:DNA alkylation repair protein [Aerococcaceae bacterium DSM 111176]|nr:DNA alkylation repair protein [Aerococcaceae bacterium DSM 111176]
MTSEVIETYTKDSILAEINDQTLLGELRKIAKEIKKDHDLAMELWDSQNFKARLLAILIMDKNQLTAETLDEMVESIAIHSYDEKNNLMDWLMSNQLTKNKKGTMIIESWQNSPMSLQRRTFWNYQGRLRWRGKNFSENTGELLSVIEESIMDEEPEVQWAMNFTAGWIGIYDEQYRERCSQLGEKTGLYKGEMVSKGCTPNYLPEFIEMEVGKLEAKNK